MAVAPAARAGVETVAASEPAPPADQPPVQQSHTDVVAQPLAAAQPTSISPGKYVVQNGDTLFSISERSDVALRDLIETNTLQPPYRLLAGQRLEIPVVRYHEVAGGETLTRIAERYGLSPRTLAVVNDIEPPHLILSGQRLRLPARLEPVQAPVPASDGSSSAIVPPTPPEHTPRGGSAVRQADDGAPRPAVKPARTLASAIPKPPRRSGRTFLWPVQGPVISGYGSKGGGFYNDGINIAVPPGTPVRAAENGVVAYVGNELRGFGNLLLLRHDGGWVTAYAHAERIEVRPGQIVRRGQVIARVGQSGRVQRPQLHFEIRKGRDAVDPLRHLPQAAAAALEIRLSGSSAG